MFVHRAEQGDDDCRALRLLHWTALRPPWKCGELYLAVSESCYGVRRSNLQQLPGIIKMVCKILWAADQLSFPEATATAAAELFNYPPWWQQQPATGSRPVTAAQADHFIHHPSIRGAISTHMSTLNRIISANYSSQTQPLLGGSNWHLSRLVCF